MGRLWLATYAILLCSSVVLASITTKYQTTYSQKNLERAAELAVERAAEKAAERAVEKSLDSGNSSTITVTVKEAYENSLRTAEEAAAPGSESTRPEGIKMNDRQYQAPAEGEYKVTDSAEAAEAEQLGISKESVNSSVENLESAEPAEGSAAQEEAGDPQEELSLTSFESFRESADKTTESTVKDFDASFGLDFGLDFGGDFDMDDRAFGSKDTSSSKTETFSTSYSKPKEGGGHVEVDDADDAEIFGMYASGDDGSKWSSAKEQGWTRHRQLWDDSKRVSRESGWEDFEALVKGSGGGDDDGGEKDDEKKREKKSTDKTKRKLFKRMAGDYEAAESTNQVAVPLASLSLDPKAPALLYQLLQKELKYSTNNYSSKLPIPMRLYVTVPVPYLRAAKIPQSDEEVTHITPRPYHATVRSDQINDEMNDQGTAATKQPVKRSDNFGGRINRAFSSRNNYERSKKQSPRSLVKVKKHKVEFIIPTTTPELDISRIKQKS